jgi:hypothetical protein
MADDASAAKEERPLPLRRETKRQRTEGKCESDIADDVCCEGDRLIFNRTTGKCERDDVVDGCCGGIRLIPILLNLKRRRRG